MNSKLNLLRYFPAILFFLVFFIIKATSAGDIKGKVHISGNKNSADAVIYIEHVTGSFAPSSNPAIMDQKDLMFMPKVLPILTGTTVNFLNSDSVPHNVFSPTKCAGSFNLGTWQKGEFRSHIFNNTNCIVTILCNVHPDMQAWIIVLQNPYFAKADNNGNYEIKNIPKGTYELKVWYPFYKTRSIQVVVNNSGIVMQDFSIKK